MAFLLIWFWLTVVLAIAWIIFASEPLYAFLFGAPVGFVVASGIYLYRYFRGPWRSSKSSTTA